MENSVVGTKYGDVLVRATQKDHIFVDFGYASPLYRRSITYRGNAHFYLWSDGTWNLGEEDKPGERHYSLWVDRVGNGFAGPSFSARNDIERELVPAVRKWAAEHPELIAEADKEHREEERNRRLDKIEELNAKIRSLQAEIAALEN